MICILLLYKTLINRYSSNGKHQCAFNMFAELATSILIIRLALLVHRNKVQDKADAIKDTKTYLLSLHESTFHHNDTKATTDFWNENCKR